jgi:16S rRNA (cytidine1402-2'-O)-methyltransferase
VPVLYLVATPIGNLEDITLRAVRVLREASLIAAEDTRTTLHLLTHHDIHTALVSYHDFSGRGRTGQLLEALGRGDVALVSEAGTPGLSDPGYELVRAAVEAGFAVIAIPGPSAAVAALVVSGLPTDRFLFLGFLPRQAGARRRALSAVAALPYTLVLYEAPHRLLATLADALELLGDRPASVSRELTKLYEETWRGPISGALEHFGRQPVRGELTIVVAGATGGAGRWSEVEVRRALAQELGRGASRKEASAVVSPGSGWSRRELYDLSLDEE